VTATGVHHAVSEIHLLKPVQAGVPNAEKTANIMWIDHHATTAANATRVRHATAWARLEPKHNRKKSRMKKKNE